MGELYAYLPLLQQNADAVAKVPPVTDENPVYGFSIGRGAFTFPTGKWITVAQRIKLNDPPSAFNGEVEVFVNGNSTIRVTGVAMRTGKETNSVIRGMHFETFFGGKTRGF